MSSRDRSDRKSDASQAAGDGSTNANANRPDGGWEFDPAEINRYLSGGSSRSASSARPSSEGPGTSMPGRRTADSLEQLRRTRQQVQQSGQQPESAANPPAARPARSRVSGRTGAPPPRTTASDPAAETTRPRTETGSVTRSYPRPTAPIEPQDEVAGYGASPDWDDTAFIDESDAPAPVANRAPRLSRPHLARPQIAVPRRAELPRPAVPAFVRGADLVNDATALALIGLSLLSLAIMAILVANRIGNVASPFATHVSASGALEHFEKNTAVWRLPLLSGMFLLMNVVAAWFVSPTDRFLSRFLLGVSAAVQLVAWIALIHFLW